MGQCCATLGDDNGETIEKLDRQIDSRNPLVKVKEVYKLSRRQHISEFIDFGTDDIVLGEGMTGCVLKVNHKVTHENLRIYGYIQTDKGIQLNYEYIQKNIKDTKKKFNENQISIIKKYHSKFKNKKNSILNLELNENIKISIGTYNKIIENKY